jgi:hypothetical protein
MHTIFWPKRRWTSKSDTVSALEGFARTRGNQARGAVGIVGRLVIIHGLVKKM